MWSSHGNEILAYDGLHLHMASGHSYASGGPLHLEIPMLLGGELVENFQWARSIGSSD